MIRKCDKNPKDEGNKEMLGNVLNDCVFVALLCDEENERSWFEDRPTFLYSI